MPSRVNERSLAGGPRWCVHCPGWVAEADWPSHVHNTAVSALDRANARYAEWWERMRPKPPAPAPSPEPEPGGITALGFLKTLAWLGLGLAAGYVATLLLT